MNKPIPEDWDLLKRNRQQPENISRADLNALFRRFCEAAMSLHATQTTSILARSTLFALCHVPTRRPHLERATCARVIVGQYSCVIIS
jgi:hypothetical protein